MIKPFSLKFTSAITILFACSSIPAFANHGGGRHGGGGFHGGGGGASMAAEAAVASTVVAVAFARAAEADVHRAARCGVCRSACRRSLWFSSGRVAARPGGNYSRPGGNSGGGNQRYGNSSSAPPAVADGRWHSFGGSAGGRGPSGGQSAAGSSGNAGGFHVFSGNRPAGSRGQSVVFQGKAAKSGKMRPRREMLCPVSSACDYSQFVQQFRCRRIRIAVELDTFSVFAIFTAGQRWLATVDFRVA